jgi:hypothetical protein
VVLADRRLLGAKIEFVMTKFGSRSRGIQLEELPLSCLLAMMAFHSESQGQKAGWGVAIIRGIRPAYDCVCADREWRRARCSSW